MDREVWKAIDGYEGLYQISTFGRVKSLRDCNQKPREKILSPSDRNGYLQINLLRFGEKRCFKVHRLVACAFIPNPEHKPEVNHIDGDKHNNFVINLEWATAKENIQHAVKTGLLKTGGNRKLSEKEVQAIRKEYVRGSKGEGSVRVLASKYNVCDMTIYKLLQGKTYTDME